MMHMKTRGRVHWMIVTAIVCALAVGVVLVTGKQGPEVNCQAWLVALAKHDAKTLSSLSYMEAQDEKTTEEEWNRTFRDAAPFFCFTWRFRGVTQATPTRASVDLEWVKAADTPGSYPENYGIPLEKVDGIWKVDVRSIDRSMFPGLPR